MGVFSCLDSLSFSCKHELTLFSWYYNNLFYLTFGCWLFNFVLQNPPNTLVSFFVLLRVKWLGNGLCIISCILLLLMQSRFCICQAEVFLSFLLEKDVFTHPLFLKWHFDLFMQQDNLIGLFLWFKYGFLMTFNMFEKFLAYREVFVK